MTVDMLAAAFIWPEEMLVGRTHIEDDWEVDHLAPFPASRAAAASEPEPFWATLLRHIRIVMRRTAG